MKNRLEFPTLSIGIPAHNEEGNIIFLLESILAQKQNNFKLGKIYVVCDGCTDSTATKVKEIAKFNRSILLRDDKKRQGKAARLNQIYRLNQSDLLLTLDADVIFENPDSLDQIVSHMISDKRFAVLTSKITPLVSKNDWIARLLLFNNQTWKNLTYELNNGSNVFNFTGSLSLLRKGFSKSVTYPSKITNDQGYLYFSAIKNWKVGFCNDAGICMYIPSNLKDYRQLASRSSLERANLEKLFKRKLLKEYSIPRRLKIKHALLALRKNPFYTFLSVFINFWVNTLPDKDDNWVNGTWKQTNSTKQGIKRLAMTKH